MSAFEGLILLVVMLTYLCILNVSKTLDETNNIQNYAINAFEFTCKKILQKVNLTNYLTEIYSSDLNELYSYHMYVQRED